MKRNFYEVNLRVLAHCLLDAGKMADMFFALVYLFEIFYVF